MRIEVNSKSLDILGRSVWERIAEPKTKRSAFAIAKKESKKAIETEVICFDDDGDVCGHSFYQKGKLKIDMSI